MRSNSAAVAKSRLQIIIGVDRMRELDWRAKPMREWARTLSQMPYVLRHPGHRKSGKSRTMPYHMYLQMLQHFPEARGARWRVTPEGDGFVMEGYCVGGATVTISPRFLNPTLNIERDLFALQTIVDKWNSL